MNTRHQTFYRGCPPVVETWYEREGEQTLTVALAEALAEAENVDVDGLPPLYESLDVDALSRLFERSVGTADAEAVFSFRIGHWSVFVSADGKIRICDATRLTAPEPVFEQNTVGAQSE